MVEKIIRPSVVLIKGTKILLLKSKYSSGEFYLLPGGGNEGFETIEETAIRETKEETGYDIRIEKLLYLSEWIEKKRNKNVLYIIFLGKIKGGKETHLNDPCLEKDNIQAIEWVEVKDLNKIKFYPEKIIPYLQKDSLKKFSNDAIFINSKF